MLHFIVNPFSGSQKRARIWMDIEKVLKERDPDYKVYLTEYKNHATEIARELTKDDAEKTIVVIGGDGFLNEVLNGFQRFQGITLGYIPSGSGNDFGRTFKLLRKPEELLGAIIEPEDFCEIDIGEAFYGGQKRYFAVSSGIGFDAGVCHGVDKTPLKAFLNKIRLGKLVYFLMAVKQILTQDRVPMKVLLDQGLPTERKLEFTKGLFAVAMNCGYEGGGYRFCPDARPDDGMLDLCVINKVPTFNFLWMMPFCFSGKHVIFKSYVNIYRCKTMQIRTAESLPVHTDGEPVPYQNGIFMRLSDEKLRVIVG